MTPTVQEVLDSSYESSGWYRWRINGRLRLVFVDDLREGLEAAYDPCVPEWPYFVDLE